MSPRLGPNYLLYVSSKGASEGIWKLADGTATELWSAPGTRIIGGPAIAADGRRIAFSIEERGRTLDRAFAQATGARCRGLLLAATGDVAGALAALDRALEAHQRLPQPFELARTLMARGTVQRRGKQKRAARGSLQQATDIFERLGASVWVQRARAELERTLAEGVEKMPKLERTILTLYYKEEQNLQDIAEILGIHTTRVCQLKSQAVLRLRAYMTKKWPSSRGIL